MKKYLVAVVLACVIATTGCSAAWVSTLDTILAVAAPALINILEIAAIAKGETPDAAQIAKVQKDADEVRTLAADFAKASSVASPGVCAQLQAAIGAYQQDSQTILSLAQVSDTNTQTKINLLAGLVSGTVSEILTLVPSCSSTKMSMSYNMTQPPLKVRTFVSTYNAILTTKTGNQKVDAFTPTKKIHAHGKMMRYGSLGLLQ